MSDNIGVNIIAGLIILISIVEIFIGVAVEKPGLVRRSERPTTYWFSVICKLVIGLAILNIEYLRIKFGS